MLLFIEPVATSGCEVSNEILIAGSLRYPRAMLAIRVLGIANLLDFDLMSVAGSTAQPGAGGR